MNLGRLFARFANAVAHATGQPATFALAVLSIVAWAATGPLFGYSENWQLVINTGTTIVTFLMVFLIQNTQNREGHAVQIKLDELIKVIEQAHNGLLDLEELEEAELDSIRAEYQKLARQARKASRLGPSARAG